MVSLVAFRAEHLLEIASRNPFDNDLLTGAVDKERSPSYTALVDNKIVACAGVQLLRPGVGYAWTVLSHDFPKHKLWVTRTIRNVLRGIVIGCNLHRMEAHVLESQIAERKWIELFGFEPEGIAHEYTSDRRSVVRYEWLRYKIRVRLLKAGEIKEFDELVRACGYPNAENIAEWYHEDSRILVATENTRLIGYAVHGYVTYATGLAAIGRNMAVRPEYHNRGIGEKLHSARLALARDEGAVQFVGHVKGSNPSLVRIFQKYGARHPIETELGTLWITRLK